MTSVQVTPKNAVKFQKTLLEMQSAALFKDMLEAQKKAKKGKAKKPEPVVKAVRRGPLKKNRE